MIKLRDIICYGFLIIGAALVTFLVCRGADVKTCDGEGTTAIYEEYVTEAGTTDIEINY